MKHALLFLALLPGLAVGQVQILGTEVTQSVQTLDNDVPLVAMKPTIIRVYATATTELKDLTAHLTVRSGGQTAVLTAGPMSVQPNSNIIVLRNNLALSFCFKLPLAMTTGKLTIVAVEIHDAQGQLLSCTGCQFGRDLPPFASVPPLHIKLIGLSFAIPGSNRVARPRDLDFERIESWLQRAYPISKLISNRTLMDASEQGLSAANLRCNDVNAVLSVIRLRDQGVDPGTHYYGLIPDDIGFIPGCSSGIPQQPDPTVVASGPSGIPRRISDTLDFSWDTDGSYAGWYAGHELAHTFGRYHPGFCNQGINDSGFPYSNGHLSDSDDKYVGFDSGDAVTKPAALPGVVWTDIMTYCSYVWPSNYTYEALITRVQAEASAAGPGSQVTPQQPIRGINFIASVNITKRTGKIRDVSWIPQVPSPPFESLPRTSVRSLDALGKTIYQQPVQLRFDSDIPAGADQTALINVVVPYLADIQKLQLLIEDSVLDEIAVETEERIAHLSALKTKQLNKANAKDFVAFMTGISEEETTEGMLLRWTDSSSSSIYTVQVGVEGGPLETLAISVKRKYYLIRKSVLDRYRGKKMQISVSTNNLSRSEALTKTVSVQ